MRELENKNDSKRLTIAGILIALSILGSAFSFPVFGSKCAPIQHFVNIMGAVILGPINNLIIAFLASLFRNMLSLGSLLAFPGSMIGAFISGILFKKTKNIFLTILGEVFGTGILGGLLSYPIAISFMGKSAGTLAFYAYVLPFLISTIGGSILGGFLYFALKKTHAIDKLEYNNAK